MDPERDMIRLCRRLLLEYLNVAYPKHLPEETILQAMIGLSSPIPPRFVQRDLGYLRGRGMIASDQRADESPSLDRRLPRPPVTWWALTSKGIEFVERGFPWHEIEEL